MFFKVSQSFRVGGFHYVWFSLAVGSKEGKNVIFLLEEIIPHSKKLSFGLGGGPQDSWKRLPTKLRQCSPDQAEKSRGTLKKIVILNSAFSRLALEMF